MMLRDGLSSEFGSPEAVLGLAACRLELAVRLLWLSSLLVLLIVIS